ncbi:hypothetical protein CK203_019930 [Vitis vinifera]|uniref:Uncharacterized protein n=1 Tax=Vitis vinifera TaxID=29760 RepID=A0A438J397_VITVI|nr:hypothetical protein CK203_019930 [Vitis vinifera]
MPFVYKFMHVMKENLICQRAGDWIFKIIKDRWEKTLKHPLHSAACAFRDAQRGFGDQTAIATRSTMVPGESLYEKIDYHYFEVGEEKDNRLFQWIRPIHLENEIRNPDSRIATHAREFGVNVERVLSEEVHSESFSKDTDNSVQTTLNSYQELDSTSVGHSSRPSAAYTFASGYDGSRGGTDDGDHGSKRAGPSIGVIGKPYRGRERTMEPYNEELLSRSFESMSIGTQFSDSSNETNVYPPYKMSYGQPSSSTDEEYGMSRCSPSRQMSYQVPYQMEGGFGINTWVNFEYPIHVEIVNELEILVTPMDGEVIFEAWSDKWKMEWRRIHNVDEEEEEMHLDQALELN